MPFFCVSSVNNGYSALVFWLPPSLSLYSFSGKVWEIFFWFVQAGSAKICSGEDRGFQIIG